MGYAATRILLYGVALSEEIAEKIYERFGKKDENDEIVEWTLVKDGDVRYLRKLRSPDDARDAKPNSIEITDSPAHDIGCGGELFDPQLLSDDTDSRCENLTFEPGYDHYLGIYVGSKGYAYNDDLKVLRKVKTMNPLVLSQFKKYIQPVLNEFCIMDEPEIQEIMQTW